MSRVMYREAQRLKLDLKEFRGYRRRRRNPLSGKFRSYRRLRG